MCSGEEKAVEVLEPEPAEGEEEEEGGEVDKDLATGGAEKEEEEPSTSEETQELPESLKPKMKLFSGNLAAGLRIRAEPSYVVIYRCKCTCKVLPTLVRSGQPQPPLIYFYHHSGLFCHHSQSVNSAEMLYLMQLDNTLAIVQPSLRLPGQNPIHVHSLYA